MFTHLHVHSEFSLLDGLPRLDSIVERAKELGMESIALTDHGVMYGTHKFYQACKYADIKAITGCEVYVAQRDRFQKMVNLDDSPYHLVLLAKDETGYHNLIKLISLANLEGFYYKPRVDKELLRKYSEGLIALSACLGGEIPRLIQNGKMQAAVDTAKEYQEIFGKGNFYLELQRNKIKEQEPVNQALLDISKKTGIPVVATCDAHYTKKEESNAQEALMCISTGKQMDDPNRMRMETDELYIKSEDEMKELFKDIPEALENTQIIANQCNVEIEMKEWTLPDPPIDKTYGKDYDKYLFDITNQRGKKKLGRELTKEESDRIKYEWGIISEKGFSKYMVMVGQFAEWIRNNNIPMTVRGSAAGSFLAYCIDIISANPFQFNLAFERFLNPLRPKAPDIDIDIASSHREELIENAIETYGSESTAHIVTFGRMQARGSIRDAGRVLGLPLSYVDKIAKLIPASGQGMAKVNIANAIEEVEEMRQLIEQDPDAKSLIDTAQKIEGVAKSQGVHACGILITPGPIIEHCPVIWDKSIGNNGRMITQYEMDSLEELGLIKMDFLGLTNLDTIAEAVKIIKTERGEDIDPEDLPLDDKPTYKLIKDLDTEGVFQLESDVMKQTLKILQPENIFDVSASLALVRPGPNQYQQEYADRKFGRKKVKYLDPRMKDFLELSYGVLVYQEDIIKTVINLGGMDWGQADKVRKATGKKKPDVLFGMQDDLLQRFQDHGLTEEKANELFDLFIPFTNYAFNQAHAAAYSLVTYQTAYLKTHYRVEFMAALLKSEINDFDKISNVISECNKKGIKILPPNINKSKVDFSIEDKTNIRFGLAGIKNLGKAAVRLIIEERKNKGEPFKNFDEFLSRIPLDHINSKAILYLIQVGAFDQFGERNTLAAALPNLYDRYKKIQTSKALGQIDIFSMGQSDEATEIEASDLPETPAATDAQKIEWEKELLGMYITAHPLGKIKPYLDSKGGQMIKSLKTFEANRSVQIGAIITNIKRITTRKNKTMAFITLEDSTGEIEGILFPDGYTTNAEILEKNVPMLVTGKMNIREGERSIIVETIIKIDLEEAQQVSKGVHLKIIQDSNKEAIQKLKEVLKQNPGTTSVTVHIPSGNNTKVMQLKHGINLTPDVELAIQAFRLE